jgi:hypothetical protein
MSIDPKDSNAFWALARWLGMGLQRLLHQVVVLVVAVLVVLITSLAVPQEDAADVATVVGVISGVLLFLGGAAAGTVVKQLARPVIALCVLAAAYALFVAFSDNELIGGAAGVAGGLWLLTLVEFGLRGAGRAGLTGERDVESRLEEPDDAERYRYKWPRGGLAGALLCAYAGLTLAILVVVLTLAY